MAIVEPLDLRQSSPAPSLLATNQNVIPKSLRKLWHPWPDVLHLEE